MDEKQSPRSPRASAPATRTTAPAAAADNTVANHNVRAAMAVSAVLPGDPPGPCPELLTEGEAIRYLRLDLIDVDEPANTLRYYRKRGLLRATQVGKCVRYRRLELDRLLDRLTDDNPR